MRLVREDGLPPMDPLIGQTIDWPHDGRMRVLAIEHEYDDGTTLVRLDGPHAGTQTMRDTFAVRRLAEGTER